MRLTEQEKETIQNAIDFGFKKNNVDKANALETMKYEFDNEDAIWVLAQLFHKLRSMDGMTKDSTRVRFNEELCRSQTALVGRFIGRSLPEKLKPTLDIFTSVPEYADILKMEIDPEEAGISPSKKLAMKRAAKFFALMIFYSDKYYKIEENGQSRRFFEIISRLPMELQMLLAHRLVDSMGDSIITQFSEQAFRYFVNVEQLERNQQLTGNEFTLIAIRDFKNADTEEALMLRLESSKAKNAIIIEGINRKNIGIVADKMPKIDTLTFMSNGHKNWSTRVFPKNIQVVNFFHPVVYSYETVQTAHSKPENLVSWDTHSTLTFWDAKAPDIYFWSNSSLQLGRELTPEIIKNLPKTIMHLILHHKPSKDLWAQLPLHIKSVQYKEENLLTLMTRSGITESERELVVNTRFIKKDLPWGTLDKAGPSVLIQNSIFPAASNHSVAEEFLNEAVAERQTNSTTGLT